MSIPVAETSTPKIFDILNTYEDEIVNSFRDHAAVGVIAPSATGKSLLIPLYLAKTGNRVLVATITNNAAKSLAQFFATLVPTRTCSYLDVDKEIKYGPAEQERQESSIVYTSTSNVRRILEKQFVDGTPQPFSDYNVIMLDEIHTGTVDQTICLGLWKSAIRTVMFPRLLMTTATPVKYMQDVTPSYRELDLRSEMRTPYPIERRWIHVDTSGMDLYNKRKVIYKSVAEHVVSVHRDTPVVSGHIIVFLDTKDAVQRIGNNVTEMIGALNLQDRGAVVLKVYGRIDPEVSRSLYSNTWTTENDGSTLKTDNIRKIILSTNVLESSVTIPYVGHVLDSMLRIRQMESSTGRVAPTLVYASRNSSIQAAGRTGRTNPGVNYIFLSKEAFDGLPEEDPSELSVSPIGREMIDLLLKKLTPAEILFNVSPDRIDAVGMELETLSMVQKGTRNITVSGQFCSQFTPLTLRNSLVFYNFMIFTSRPETLYFEFVLSCILDIDISKLFKYPYKKGNSYNITLKEHTQTYWSDIIGRTQVETILNLWNKVGILSNGKALLPKESSIRRDVCKKLSIRSYVLDQIVKVVDAAIHLFQKIYPHVSVIIPRYHAKGVNYLGVEINSEPIGILMDRLIKIVSTVYHDSILTNHFLHFRDRTPIPNAYYKFGKKGVKGSGISYIILNQIVPGPLQDYNEIVVLSKMNYESRYKGGIRYNYGIVLHLPTPNSMRMQDVEILTKVRAQSQEQEKIESISYQFEGLLPSMEPAETFQSKPLPDLLFESSGKDKEELPEVAPNILIPRRDKLEIQRLGRKLIENSMIKVLQLPKDKIFVPRGTLVGVIQFKL